MQSKLFMNLLLLVLLLSYVSASAIERKAGWADIENNLVSPLICDAPEMSVTSERPSPDETAIGTENANLPAVDQALIVPLTRSVQLREAMRPYMETPYIGCPLLLSIWLSSLGCVLALLWTFGPTDPLEFLGVSAAAVLADFILFGRFYYWAMVTYNLQGRPASSAQ